MCCRLAEISLLIILLLKMVSWSEYEAPIANLDYDFYDIDGDEGGAEQKRKEQSFPV